MTGEKETKVGQNITEQPKNITEPLDTGTLPPEAPEKAYTQKDIDDAKLQAKAESDKAYQGLQKVISKKDRELEALNQKLVQSLPSATNTQALQTVVSQLERMATESGVDTSELRQAKANLDAEQRRVAAMTIIATEKQKLEKEITDKGEDPADEKFDGVWRDFEFSSYVSGDFNKPKTTLEKTLVKSKKEVMPPQPQESEEARVEEKARKMLEEKGLLVSDIGAPSAQSRSREDVIARWARGEATREEYEKALKS